MKLVVYRLCSHLQCTTARWSGDNLSYQLVDPLPEPTSVGRTLVMMIALTAF